LNKEGDSNKTTIAFCFGFATTKKVMTPSCFLICCSEEGNCYRLLLFWFCWQCRHLLFGFVVRKKVIVAFAFFFYVVTKKVTTAYVVALLFMLKNLCGCVIAKKKKKTTFVTFNGFVAKKWRWELHSSFLAVFLQRR